MRGHHRGSCSRRATQQGDLMVNTSRGPAQRATARAGGFLKLNLRQRLPAAGIIEESESARGERGKVGQGRAGFKVQARARWERPIMQPVCLKKWFLITKMFCGSICVRR